MITRIVKLSFKEEKINDFIKTFYFKQPKIEQFKGCKGASLYRVSDKKNEFVTYSLWESEEDLNNYRASDFFRSTWKVVKTYFSEPPIAWSMEKQEDV